jgi:osmoprotectant transport system permease protein
MVTYGAGWFITGPCLKWRYYRLNYLLNPNSYNPADPNSIPNLVLRHMYIVGVAMIISILIAVPLGLLISRYKRLYTPLVTFTGLLYSIPAIAFVAILITITGLSLGTIVIPLIVYNQLVLISNTAAAVNNIDPLYLDVGRGMGMNPPQLFYRVTLPLAMPVIVAGIRLATVTTIGIASLAGFIGQGGLGSLIFMNYTVGDYDAIFAGAFLLAVLAIAADLLLLALQSWLNRGRNMAPAR